MEKIKCFICLEEQDEQNMIKICKCKESYICLQPCYQVFVLEKNINFMDPAVIKCPICKKGKESLHTVFCDWRRTLYLCEIYFLVFYYPFIMIIWPMIYIFRLQSSIKENNEFMYKNTDNVAVGFFSQLGVIFVGGLLYNIFRLDSKNSIIRKKQTYFRIITAYYTLSSIVAAITDNYVVSARDVLGSSQGIETRAVGGSVYFQDRFLRNFLLIHSLSLLFLSVRVIYYFLCLMKIIIVLMMVEVPIIVRKIGINCGCLVIRPVHPVNGDEEC